MTSLIIASLTIIALFLFWVTGIIPSYIAKTSAEKYVESRYKDKDLKFLEVRWDSFWDRFFVSFTDKSGNIYGFKMSEYVPTSIMYDPLNPPG
jgi:hypothetical protein